jgi:hypothetical protein
MFGMLVAARLKFWSSSAPPMTSAFFRPSVSKLATSALVLASESASSSTMMRLSMPWPWPTGHASGRARGPSWEGHARGCERPGRGPCRRRGTAERVPNGDERGPYPSACTSWRRCGRFPRGPWPCACPAASWRAASARRAAGCPRAGRGRRSPPFSSTLPASLPARVVILRSIIPLPRRPSRAFASGFARSAAGFGASFRQRDLGGVAHHDPCTLRTAGDGAADEDEAAIDVGRDDLDVLRGDANVEPM